MVVPEDESCDDLQVIPNSRTSKTRELAQFKSEVFSDFVEVKSEVESFDSYTVSDIKQMAGAILNGELGTFKDTDVTNYGCSGCFQLLIDQVNQFDPRPRAFASGYDHTK